MKGRRKTAKTQSLNPTIFISDGGGGGGGGEKKSGKREEKSRKDWHTKTKTIAHINPTPTSHTPQGSRPWVSGVGVVVPR